ncbi:MAG: hypothetical protein MK102_00915 [Fuerstiella sp.]|nr:hypothetical protein [Fuerstiella sp.]
MCSVQICGDWPFNRTIPDPAQTIATLTLRTEREPEFIPANNALSSTSLITIILGVDTQYKHSRSGVKTALTVDVIIFSLLMHGDNDE